MARRIVYCVLLAGFMICLAPLCAIIWSSWFAKRHGCTLHEGYTNPCLVNGHDYGDTLYAAFVSGWFMLLTLPAGAVILLALLIMVGVDLYRRWRAR